MCDRAWRGLGVSDLHPRDPGGAPGRPGAGWELGDSRVRSYFRTPFASPRARRSPPPPRRWPPAPGRRFFFTTSHCPPPALAAMTPTPPMGFPARARSLCHVCLLPGVARLTSPPRSILGLVVFSWSGSAGPPASHPKDAGSGTQDHASSNSHGAGDVVALGLEG